MFRRWPRQLLRHVLAMQRSWQVPLAFVPRVLPRSVLQVQRDEASRRCRLVPGVLGVGALDTMRMRSVGFRGESFRLARDRVQSVRRHARSFRRGSRRADVHEVSHAVSGVSPGRQRTVLPEDALLVQLPRQVANKYENSNGMDLVVSPRD